MQDTGERKGQSEAIAVMTEYFNKPWMEKINPDLLYRFWEKKKSAKPIRIASGYGFNVTYIRSSFGETSIIETGCPMDTLFRKQVDQKL